MRRRARARTADALVAVAAALLLGACSTEQPPPPAPQHVIEFSATGTAGGTAFGSYVPVGQLGTTADAGFTGLPFRLTVPVGYPPEPKMRVSLVGVPPRSSVSCRITVDGRVVASQTIPAPGPDAICAGS